MCGLKTPDGERITPNVLSCMVTQVSVTAAFKSCGKRESAISTNTHPCLLS